MYETYDKAGLLPYLRFSCSSGVGDCSALRLMVGREPGKGVGRVTVAVVSCCRWAPNERPYGVLVAGRAFVCMYSTDSGWS